MDRILSESTANVRTVFVKIRNLQPFDVTWAGSIVLSVDVASNDAYRIVKFRKNSADGNDADIRSAFYHEDGDIQLMA